MATDPLSKSKEEYATIVEQIGAVGSPVGIDAQYTHAIIIEYLHQISERLDRLETRLADRFSVFKQPCSAARLLSGFSAPWLVKRANDGKEVLPIKMIRVIA